MKKIIQFLFLVSLTTVFAQNSIITCQKNNPNQVNYACGTCEEPLLNQLNGNDTQEGLFELLGKVGSDKLEESISKDLVPKGIKDIDFAKALKETNSVESFLENMPKLMGKSVAKNLLSNVMIIDPSRSLQKGQRFLLKSPNSEFVMSFNSDHDKHRSGGKSIEMMSWNGKKGVFELAELSFNGGKPRLEKNPSKCLHCHGEAPLTKPMMEAFPIWPNQLPAVQDTILGGTSEDRRMKKLLNEIKESIALSKAKGPKREFKRLAALEPFFQINKDLLKDYKGSERIVNVDGRGFKGDRGDHSHGVAVKMTSELMVLNMCRMNTLLNNPKITPQSDIIKNRLKALASLKRCTLRPEMLPKKMQEMIRKYYIKVFKLDPAATLNEVSGRVWQDTSQRANSYFEDRVGRSFWNIEKYYREEIGLSSEESFKRATDEVDRHKNPKIESFVDIDDFITAKENAENFENFDSLNVDRITQMRLILEPFDVPLNQFSMNIDPGFLALQGIAFELDGFINKDEPSELLCAEFDQRLAQILLDRKRRTSLPCHKEVVTLMDEDKVKDFIKGGEEIASKTQRLKLRPKVQKTVAQCVGCHSSEAFGAPLIPFHDMDKMDEIFKREKGHMGALATKIVRRVNRSKGTPGAMPLFMPKLSDQKINDLTDYLSTFQDNKP